MALSLKTCAILVAAAAVVTACGSVVTGPMQPGDASRPRDAVSDSVSAPPDTRGDRVVTPTLLCPVRPPPLGTSCETAAQCEYGTNIEPACNALFTCSRGKWTTVGLSAACAPPDAGLSCAVSYAAVPAGMDCTPDGGHLSYEPTCSYPQGSCYCSGSINHATSPAWICVPTPTGCPQPPADMGQPCTRDGLDCDYGGCYGGAAVTCSSGVWQALDFRCPG